MTIFPYSDTTFEEFAQANRMTLGQAAKALERLYREGKLEVSKHTSGNYVYRVVDLVK